MRAQLPTISTRIPRRQTNAEDGQQEEGGSTKQPRDSRPAPSSDPHSDLMSAIKNRASISLKPATEASRSQRSQSLPPEKADIMSQLAGDLAKRRVSIAVRFVCLSHIRFHALAKSE